MSKYLTIKRLFEAEEAQTPMPVAQVQSMDQFQAANGNQQMADVANDAPEQPQMEPNGEEQLALPSGEVMMMSIGDFLTKVETINPLIGIGLKTFIDSHTDQLTSTSEQPQTDPTADVTFSNAIDDQPEVANFDTPTDQLAFPQ
jgi:hypothetical protein